jgi:hypothetical protein
MYTVSIFCFTALLWLTAHAAVAAVPGDKVYFRFGGNDQYCLRVVPDNAGKMERVGQLALERCTPNPPGDFAKQVDQFSRFVWKFYTNGIGPIPQANDGERDRLVLDTERYRVCSLDPNVFVAQAARRTGGIWPRQNFFYHEDEQQIRLNYTRRAATENITDCRVAAKWGAKCGNKEGVCQLTKKELCPSEFEEYIGCDTGNSRCEILTHKADPQFGDLDLYDATTVPVPLPNCTRHGYSVCRQNCPEVNGLCLTARQGIQSRASTQDRSMGLEQCKPGDKRMKWIKEKANDLRLS